MNKNITVCRLRGKNTMWSRMVTCHALLNLLLAGRLNCRGLQTLTKQILSLPGSSLFASQLEVLSCAFCFGQELTFDDFLLCLVTRCFQGTEFSRVVIY